MFVDPHMPFDRSGSLASSGKPDVQCKLNRLHLETRPMFLRIPPGPLQSIPQRRDGNCQLHSAWGVRQRLS